MKVHAVKLEYIFGYIQNRGMKGGYFTMSEMAPFVFELFPAFRD